MSDITKKKWERKIENVSPMDIKINMTEVKKKFIEGVVRGTYHGWRASLSLWLDEICEKQPELCKEIDKIEILLYSGYDKFPEVKKRVEKLLEKIKYNRAKVIEALDVLDNAYQEMRKRKLLEKVI